VPALSNAAQPIAPPARIALTGATGYIGGRLGPKLVEAGYDVRAIARTPEKLADRSWVGDGKASIAQCDLLEGDVERALQGCEAAFYLVHAMVSSGSEFAERDRDMAERFAKAAKAAGVNRIIYLGGLGEMGEGLSEHLASRREVEQVLASQGVPVTTLRAAIIIGSGSASFEILRYLVEHLPVMITPRWVSTECQPIAVRDVLTYLQQTLTTPQTTGRTLEIGGPDVLRYLDLLRIMADERGLKKRFVIPVPVLTPRLSSYWIHLVTPLDARIARPLAEGLRNRVVVKDDSIRDLIPFEPLAVRESIRKAIERIETQDVETAWSAAGPIKGDPDWAGGTVFEDARTIEIDAPAEHVWRAVCRVGGGHGWYAADWLWKLRGVVDVLVGGPGLRRGRRDPENVRYGEALDFWRVIGVEQNKSLRLLAEMKLPGEAELRFDLDEAGSTTRLTQTARFRPKGLLGLAYWYAVLPMHNIVFNGMTRGIRRGAEELQAEETQAQAARSSHS